LIQDRLNSELILNSDGSVYHLGLLPENLAPTVIFVGDPGRVARVTAHFDSIEFQKEKREFVTHTGSYRGKRLSVISTGISTDNVDIVINELDALVNFDLSTGTPNSARKALKILRLGTSGSIHPKVAVDSILVSINAIGLDGLDRHYIQNVPGSQPYGWNDFSVYLNDIIDVPTYISSADPSLLQAFTEFKSGTTITCPGFYGPQGRSLYLKSRIGPFLDEFYNHRIDDIPVTNMEMETAGIYLLSSLLGHRALSVNAILANRITGTFSTQPDVVVDSMIEKCLEKIASID